MHGGKIFTIRSICFQVLMNQERHVKQAHLDPGLGMFLPIVGDT